MLSPHEKLAILGFVRSVISAEAGGGRDPEPPQLPLLDAPGACFVTLREGPDIRGCIGSAEAFEPLADNLRRNAVNAAFADPAFPPLDSDELNYVTIEVALLSAPHRSSPDEVVPGRDGVIIETAEGRRALFLPEVATAQNWGKTELLAHLARKAGADETVLRAPGTAIYTFQTERFSE